MESGSSSSHSSVDLEDEDADRDQDAYLTVSHDRMLELPKDASTAEADRTGQTALHFKVQSKMSRVPLIRRSGHSLKEDLINHTSDLHNSEIALNSQNEGKVSRMNITKERADSESSKAYDSAKNGDTLTRDEGILNNVIVFTSESKDEKNNTSEPGTEIIHGVQFNVNNDLNESRNVKQTEKTIMKHSCDEEHQVDKTFVCSRVDETLNPSADVGNIQICASPENIHQNDGDHKKDEKLTKDKEERTNGKFELRTSNHTKQPFNILAHKDRSILNRNKSKSNFKYSLLNTQVKDKTRKSPEQTGSRGGTVAKAKSKMKSKCAHSNSGTPSPRKKVIDYAQSKILHPVTTQQHAQGRELRSAQQLRKPCVEETPRSKSAVDLITYKDMFQQIQSQSQEGPAIYEMFAGPVYENLRVPYTCEKLNQRSPPQCAPPKKTQQGLKAKHRQLKSAHSKPKRSPAETTVVSAKSKAKPVMPRIKTPDVRKGIHKGRNNPQLDTEVVLNKGVNICQDKGESHLSTIEETFPTHDSETLTTPTSASHGADFRHTHKNIQDATVSSLTGNQNRPLPEPVLSQRPHRPKMDTWTSSSSNSYTITSPVYQKFLDEAGDGPLTDDLLQCLAEELISLDERDASTGPLNPNHEKINQESSREDDCAMGLNMFSEVTVLEVKLSNLYLPINTAG